MKLVQRFVNMLFDAAFWAIQRAFALYMRLRRHGKQEL